MPSDRGARSRLDRPLDLWVAGHVNVDHLLNVRRLPARDRTVPATGHEVQLGGTAGNIARAAAGWGVRTGLMARLGEDFPERFLQQFADERIDLRGIERVPGRPTPACFIAEDGRGGQSTIIDQGPMGDDGAWRPDPRLLNDAGWIHLTTGPVDDLLRLKRAARSAGLRVSADPAQEIHYRWSRRQAEELLDGTELLFGNESEVSRLRSILGFRRESELLERVAAVVVTRGPRGARALTRAGACEVDASRPSKVRQVTGAGDAFRGGFYAAWFEGEPLPGCLAAGTRSARSWIETGGPSSGGSRR